MTTLHIEHPITDYDTWKGAFDRFADVRREAGVLAHRIHRPVDDDLYVVVDLDFAVADRAERFLTFLRERVWAVPDSSPALAGEPRTRLLRAVEHQGARPVLPSS